MKLIFVICMKYVYNNKTNDESRFSKRRGKVLKSDSRGNRKVLEKIK